MLKPANHRTRPLQYRSGDSILHRMGALPKILGAMGFGALALSLQELPALYALSGLILSGYGLARLSLADIWRDLRWLVLQAVILVFISVMLSGGAALEGALRAALQITLVFLPIALVLRTTGMTAMLDALRGRLPERFAFAAGATLRFVPFFARELAELIEMQRLRGAHLSLREIWRPRTWRDGLACVAVPMTVRAIEIAEEAANAAAIRGIGEPLHNSGKEMR